MSLRTETLAAPAPAPVLRPEQPADRPLIDALIARAFGPGRYVKAAERLRETNRPALGVSRTVWLGERLAGCVRMWPIRIGGAPALFLGPFAVEPDLRSLGLGARLIRAASQAAQAAGAPGVLLVGDAPYFSSLGYARLAGDPVILPGPVDPARVLALGFGPAPPAFAGAVTPDPEADWGPGPGAEPVRELADRGSHDTAASR